MRYRLHTWTIPIAGMLLLGLLPLLYAQTPVPAGGEAPSTEVPRGSCVTGECHAQVKQHEYIHGPVNVDSCDACHTLTDAQSHTFELTRATNEMCTFCHVMNVDSAATVHQPLIDGQCMDCHDPHGGSTQQMLKAASASDLCQQCHVDVIGNNSVIHGPVAAGACGACHTPHASDFPNLLSAEGSDLCLECHVSTSHQLEERRVVHQPVKDNCQGCHNAHASNHVMMLRADPVDLCNECHQDVRNTIESARVDHSAVTAEGGCMNCHEAHASDFESVLKKDTLSLCMDCHDQTIQIPDGGQVANLQQQLTAGHSLHGPVAQQECSPCHEVHGSDNFRLLVKEYPPEFYAPFDMGTYELCFECHNQQLVLEANTTALTDFRNGDTNLHYLHVNKDKKGRTCRACHETHASSNPKHIRNAVPFGTGGWELPIGYEKAAEGGSCSPGCHRPYAYDRENPVNYDQPDPAAPRPSASSDTHNDRGGNS